MNNAAVNIDIEGFTRTFVFISLGFIYEWNYCWVMCNSNQHFNKLPDCLPKLLYCFTFLVAVYECSDTSHVFANSCYCPSFHYSYLTGYEVWHLIAV
jgi:hypothetical protein